MSTEKMQILNDDLGIKLINYMLNEEINLQDISSSKELDLHATQKEMIDEVFKEVKQLKLSLISNDTRFFFGNFYSALPSLRKNGESLFNVCRKRCGGLFSNTETKDKLSSLLRAILISEYPNFLIIRPKHLLSSEYRLFSRIDMCEQFRKLLFGDNLENLTNKAGQYYGHHFGVSLQTNQHFSGLAGDMGRILIERSFYNSCYRDKYDQESVINELEANLSTLRNLAHGEEIEYSSYVGIKGIHLENFDFIDLEDAVLWQIKDHMNPSPHLGKFITDKPCECVLEVKHKSKLIADQKNQQKLKDNIDEHISFVIEKLKFSLMFTLVADQAVTTTFFEYGFPLHEVGKSYGKGENVWYLNILKSEHIPDLQKWYKILKNRDLTNIEIPLKRIRSAIFERTDLEDAIIDAYIAWEGMFSDAPETTFKVTGSIYRYLEKSVDYDRLKKLYNYRNTLVHGKGEIKEDLSALKKEVITIGLKCISKLLEDEAMLQLKPSARVKKILIDS